MDKVRSKLFYWFFRHRIFWSSKLDSYSYKHTDSYGNAIENTATMRVWTNKITAEVFSVSNYWWNRKRNFELGIKRLTEIWTK